MLISLGYTLLTSHLAAIITIRSISDIISFGSTPAPSSPGAQPTSFLRVCYFTTWARYRPEPANMQPSDVDPFLCSHIIMAFAWISEEGRVSLQSDWADKHVVRGLVSLKDVNPSLKVLAAVGGWNFGSELFQQVIATDESRKTFSESAVDFMQTWNFDGLDLDWEYPNATERDNFTALIQELHSAFQRHSIDKGTTPYLLAAAVPAAEKNWQGYDVPAISKYLDFINLMSYDYYGPWDNRTGHNAPLFAEDNYSVASSAKRWVKAGIPKEKIVIGLASYGHAFVLEDIHNANLNASSARGFSGRFTRTDGFVAYYEACSFLTKAQTYMLWDETGLVPYAYNRDKWISYDSIESIKIKVRWAAANQFAGVMLWSLAMDDYNGQLCSLSKGKRYPLLSMINEELRKLEPAKPVRSENRPAASSAPARVSIIPATTAPIIMTTTTASQQQQNWQTFTLTTATVPPMTTHPIMITPAATAPSIVEERVEGSGEVDNDHDNDELLPTDGLDSLWGQVSIKRIPDDNQNDGTDVKKQQQQKPSNALKNRKEEKEPKEAGYPWSPFAPQTPQTNVRSVGTTTTAPSTSPPKPRSSGQQPKPVPIFLPLPALTPRVDLIGSTIEFASRAGDINKKLLSSANFGESKSEPPSTWSSRNPTSLTSFSSTTSPRETSPVKTMSSDRTTTSQHRTSYTNPSSSTSNRIHTPTDSQWSSSLVTSKGSRPDQSNRNLQTLASPDTRKPSQSHSRYQPTPSYTWPPLYRETTTTREPQTRETLENERPFYFSKSLLQNKDLVKHISSMGQESSDGYSNTATRSSAEKSKNVRERERTRVPFNLENYLPELVDGEHQPDGRPHYPATPGIRPTIIGPGEAVDGQSSQKRDRGGTCSFDKPIRKDCHNFIQCVLGLEYEMPCPIGTVFNEEKGNCDWPSRVPECENVYRTF